MQKLQTQNELLEAKYFQVEELEERLENCWRGQEKETYTYESGGKIITVEYLVPCGEN
ncbi:hypothetical protein MCERE19_04017 [Spirosomataceae bacterium]|jgi:hypothetical protein